MNGNGSSKPVVNLQIKFYVSGADLELLRAYAEREGIPSLHHAARVLTLGVLSENPKWTAMRLDREYAVQMIRMKAWQEFSRLAEKLKAEAENNDAGGRNEEATTEKGEVTFSRETQE